MTTAKVSIDTITGIAAAAMLGSIRISVWEARKKDKGIEQEIAISKGARSKRSTSVHKHLFADCAPLEAIKSLRGEIRTWFNKYTMEWDTPWRLFSTANYFELLQDSANFEQRFQNLVAAFLKVYQTEVSKQAFERGAMFDRNEYPDVSEVAKKFRYSFDTSPVPLAGDFRVDIGQIALQELQDKLTAANELRVNAAMHDVWDRVKTQVEWVHERMTAIMEYDPDEVDEEKIYSTVPVMGPNPRFGLFIQTSDENAECDLVYTDTDELEPAEIVVGHEEKLVRVDTKKKRRPKLYDTMLDTGVELCGMLRDFNITNDPALEEARKMLESALVRVDIDSLKESTEMQSATRTAMKSIMDKFAF